MDFSKNLQNIAFGLTNAVNQAQAMAGDLLENEPVGQKPTPVLKRVQVIIYNPRVPSEGNRPLREVMKWNDPDKLIEEYMVVMRECSHGYVNYQVVGRVEVDKFPVKQDGFTYKADDFVKSLRSGKGFHEADAVNYQAILKEFDIVNQINADKYDEVWLFAFPYAGFYESIMGGPGAFWCNAPALVEGTETAKKRFIIMGYNYQRGVGEMTENFGHRAESILDYVFRGKQGDDNLWARFGRYDKANPGQAEVGVMHYAPNSERDYDWGNKRKVKSRYPTWKNFPNLAGNPIEVDDSHWGQGDILKHHKWWFELLPHVTGHVNGISYNWWRYLLDPNLVY